MNLGEIIGHINSIIDGMPYFSQVYGICELKTHTYNGTSITQPVYYDPNAAKNSKYQKLDLNQLGFTYWRQTANVSIADSSTFVSGRREYEITIPLRLFAITKRSEFPSDDAYSPHRLAATLLKAATIKGGKTLKNDLKVRKLSTIGSVYSTDSQQIISEEFTGISWSDFKQADLAVAVDIDVIAIQQNQCIIDPCEYVPSFCLQLESYVALPN